MLNLQDILERASAKGIDDRRIAEITGRNYSTVWRWRRNPNTAFVYDDGIRRLVDEIEERPRQGQ